MVNQIALGFQSVPLQPVPCVQDAMDAMDLDYVPRRGSSSSNSDTKAEWPMEDAYVPVNYISPEAYTLLIAAEASVAPRANVLAASDIEMDSNAVGLTLQAQSAAHGWYSHVLSSSAPPKRYYTTFWRSISLRLLDQSSRAIADAKDVL